MRIGIIGTGVMGRDHAQNLSAGIAGAHLTAIADVNTEAARAVAEENGAEHVFSDGKAMIGSGEVDAVIIAAPDQFHADLTLACLDAGIPVLCEKPLAPTAAESAEVVAKEKALGRELVTVGFMRRFDPGYLALKQRLEDQADGALLMTHSTHRNVEAYPGGKSSDTVTNSAVHEIDILPWVAGSPIERVQWVTGRGSSLIDSRQDPQFLLLWDGNGVLHTVEVQVHGQYGYDVRCEAVCERGSVELAPVPALVEADPLVVSSALNRSVRYPADWRPRFAAAYRAELNSWVQATLDGRIPEGAATAADAWRATLTAEALVTSMNEGGTVVEVKDI